VLCQDAITITPWGISAVPWIASWGKLNEGITGTLNDYRIADLTVDLINDPSAAPNMRTMAKARQLHGISMSVYVWIDGCTDPPQEFFRLRVRDVDLPTESQVNLELQDESIRLENYYPGTVLTKINHPHADPDDIGKVIPIPIGTVPKLRGVCVDAGWISTLSGSCLASDATVWVSELHSYSLVGSVLYIETEQVVVTAVDTTHKILTVTRNYLNTGAVSHDYGMLVVEKKATPLKWLFGGTPVTSLGAIYARFQGVDVDITSYCTKYTGATGNELSGYPGQAAVTIGTSPRIVHAISLALQNGLNVAQGNHQHSSSNSTTVTFDTATVDSTSDFQSGHDQTKLNDGDTSTYTRSGGTGFFYSYRHKAAITNSATPLALRLVLVYEVPWSNGTSAGKVQIYITDSLVETVNLATAAIAKTTIYSGWHAISSWADVYSATTKAKFSCNSLAYLYEAYWEIQTGTASAYSAAAGVALTGDLSLDGNSTANVTTFDFLSCDVVNNNLSTPVSVFNWILARAGFAYSTQQTGALPASYALNGAITEYESALSLLHKLALQCRSYFRLGIGAARLIVRPDALTPVKSIQEIRISNGEMVHGQKLTDVNDVINTINLKYNRDWSGKNSSEPYQRTLTDTDQDSITAYGTRERPELFKFDFVASDAMAADLVAFYLRWYAWQRWQHTQEAYMFEAAALEFADAVTLAFLEGEVGECAEVGFNPGNGTTSDTIGLTVVE